MGTGPLGDPGSYALVDLVPFSAEVYFRLLERVGESFWPLHMATLVLGVAAMLLMWRGRARIACMLLAAPWAWVGITFFEQRYAQLNWAGSWFAGAFLAQAALLLLLAAMGAGFDRTAITQHTTRTGIKQQSLPRAGGLVLAGFGVLAYPAIAPLSGFAPFQAETFGVHPDPTAVATLGILLVGLRGFGLWLAVSIPALWCVVTGLTLHVLNAAWGQIPPAVAVLALVLALWKTVRSK
ncbi:MFS transporter permease [Wenzhouxiangella sp. XN24]|nr:MFS transporter permease [Wenzhouxiangella sp. XN24]